MVSILIVLCVIILVLALLLAREYTQNLRIKLEKSLAEKQNQLLTKELEEKEKRFYEQEQRFSLLATKILSDKSDEISAKNEKRLSEILLPFKREVDKLGQTISDCYHAEARERFSLQERIKDLVNVNQILGKEAKELTLALKGNNRSQGQWGEIVLENVLLKSGLRKGEEYFLQESFRNSDSAHDNLRFRPDVIVRYPGSGSIVIDSKASLTAFVEYINSDNEEDSNRWGAKHVESVKRHIDELSKKSYQNLSEDNTVDFVLMFIPNDSAYMTAMQLDSSLWQRAYEKQVIIVSPTLLIGALRIIARQWDYERQSKNALEIARQAGNMYDKFVGFVEDLQKIETAINSLYKSYGEAMKKLKDGSGSLVSRAMRMREMGIITKKNLPSESIDKTLEL